MRVVGAGWGLRGDSLRPAERERVGAVVAPERPGSFAGTAGEGGGVSSGEAGLAVPDTIACGGDVGEVAPAGDAEGYVVANVALGQRFGFFVFFFYQEPVLFVIVAGAAVHSDEGPATAEFLAAELELEFAGAEAYGGVADGLPCAAVPEEDGAAAVLAFGDGAFEGAVGDGVVFDLHGEDFLGGIEAGALGDGPAFEDAVVLEAEVVVQAGGVVLLDDEGAAGFGVSDLWRGLGGAIEAAFAAVLGQVDTGAGLDTRLGERGVGARAGHWTWFGTRCLLLSRLFCAGRAAWRAWAWRRRGSAWCGLRRRGRRCSMKCVARGLCLQRSS